MYHDDWGLEHGTGAKGNYEDATMTCIRALSYCRYLLD
jgi:hypothetical protein